MNWDVRYRSSVEKDIARLPANLRRLVVETVSELAADQFPAGCKKLKGSEKRFRLRVGHDYRIIYSVLKEDRLIIIEFVGHRRDAYRWL